MPKVKQKWEEEFLKRFEFILGEEYADHEFIDFIKSILTSKAEQMEKLKTFIYEENHFSDTAPKTKFVRKDDVLEILKK